VCLIVYTLHRRSAPYGQNIAGYDADLHADSLALCGPWVSFFCPVWLWVSFSCPMWAMGQFFCPVWAIGQFLLPCVGHRSVSLALCGPWVSFSCPMWAVGKFLLPCVCHGSCRIGVVCFLAGWRKIRPEPGFSFVTFSFTYISSFL